jgi:HSP20 family protein
MPNVAHDPAHLVSRLRLFHLSLEDHAMAHDSTRQLPARFAPAFSLTQANVWQPLADVYRTQDGWLIKFDLAGVLPRDVKLTVDGSRLTLTGTRRDCCIREGCRHYRMEISYSRFERTVELPEEVEPAQVVSEFSHGMLLVRIAKT